MIAVKLTPLLLAWAGIIFVLLRGFPERRPIVAVMGSAGFAVGVAGALFLFRSFPGDLSFGIIRNLVGGGLLLLWGVSVVALYRSTVQDFPLLWGEQLADGPVFAGACAVVAGFMAGAICACRLSGTTTLPYLLLVPAAASLAITAMAIEKRLLKSFTLHKSALMAAVVSLILFSASSILRLDLFSPLTMKVMKFAHDFVHQLMESMLIPDHIFIRSYLWRYIGLLFGKEVGLWGGLF